MTSLADPPPRDKPSSTGSGQAKLRLCVKCGATFMRADDPVRSDANFFCDAYPDCRLPLNLRVADALRWARDEHIHFYGDNEDD